MAKDLDIVVFGATGFTGRLVVDYLAKHAPADLRLGIAGRDGVRLDDIVQHLAAKQKRVVVAIGADSGDPASLRAMAARTKVVITTVGPYVRYGFALAEACVREGADYCDITGEPAFVDRVMRELGEEAEKAKVKLVSCCGFDSIPHDLGAYFTMREMKPTSPVLVRGVVQAGGGISGGTWHSAIGAMSRIREKRNKPPRREPSGGRKVRSEKAKPMRLPEVAGWVLPFPSIDPEMVLRSARQIELYGPDFTYGHYVRAGSLAKAIGLGAGVGAVVALSQFGPTRELLLKAKKPGEGPTEEQRKRGFFRVTFIAKSADREFTARVSGGEPGYSETSKMISECGLALVLDRARLPERYGALTPALAFEDVLIERLTAAGIRFEVVKEGGAAS